jgi:hypothetical protein
VTFTDGKAQAMEIIKDYVDYLTHQEIVDILKNVNFSNDKLKCLEVIA